MIAADSITIDGTTAWLVQGLPVDATLDRPCDTCGGDGHLDCIDCPDCDGTGRHTFEIEVCGDPKCPHCDEDAPIHTLRVHVVEVLPIQADNSYLTDTIWARNDGTFWAIESDGYMGEPPAGNEVPLPPAAKPGMYVVRLELHE